MSVHQHTEYIGPASGAALGEYIRQVEGLEGSDEGLDRDEECHGSQERNCDPRKALPCRGPIELSGFIDRYGEGLHRRQVKDRVESDVLPDRENRE